MTKATYNQPCQTAKGSLTLYSKGRFKMGGLQPDPAGWHRLIRDSGTHRLAARGTLKAQESHEPLHVTAGYRDGFPAHLFPDFIGTIDLEVVIPDTLDMRYQNLVALG